MISVKDILQAIEPYVRGWIQRKSTWTPTVTGMTVVGGPPIYTGTYWQTGNLVHFYVSINPNGGTTASTYGTTYINNMPFTANLYNNVLAMQPANTVYIGMGRLNVASTICYLPTWAANANEIVIEGTYSV